MTDPIINLTSQIEAPVVPFDPSFGMISIDTDGQPKRADGATLIPGDETVGLEKFAPSIYPNANDARAGLNEKQVLSPASAVTILHYRNPHLYDYADGDPQLVTDWNAALSAALSDRFIDLPNTTVPFSGTVAQPRPARGAGFRGGGETVLQPNGGEGDIFLLGNVSDESPSLLFQDFRVLPSEPRTSGWAFNLKTVTYSLFSNINIGPGRDYSIFGHRINNGMLFDEYGFNRVNGCENAAAGVAFAARGRLDNNYSAELHFGNGCVVFGASVGLHLGGNCGGVQIGAVGFNNCDTNLLIDKAMTNKANREIFTLPGFVSDICNIVGIHIMPSSVERLIMTGPWLSSCLNAEAANMFVEANDETALTPFITISGGTNIVAAGQAFLFYAGDISISGHTVDLNGGGAAYNVPGNSVNLNIDGGRVRSYAVSAIGSALVTNADTRGQFRGVSIEGLFGETMVNNSTSFGISFNPGYKTQASGISTLPAGTSFIAFDPGLAQDPFPCDISLTPLTNLTEAGISSFQIATSPAPTKTSVFISLNAVPSADVTFAWQIIPHA